MPEMNKILMMGRVVIRPTPAMHPDIDPATRFTVSCKGDTFTVRVPDPQLAKHCIQLLKPQSMVYIEGSLLPGTGELSAAQVHFLTRKETSL